HGFSATSPTTSALASRPPWPLRDIDSDPPRLVLRQHLGLQRFGFLVSRVDQDQRPLASRTTQPPGTLSACRFPNLFRGARGGSWPKADAPPRLRPDPDTRDRTTPPRRDDLSWRG